MAEPQLVAMQFSVNPETNEVQSIIVSGRVPHVDGDITEYVAAHEDLDPSVLTATKRTKLKVVADLALAWLKTKRAVERGDV